jgi:hypothetical protein
MSGIGNALIHLLTASIDLVYLSLVSHAQGQPGPSRGRAAIGHQVHSRRRNQ